MTIDRAWRGHVFIATSLDGFIARPDGDLDWLTDPPHDPDHVGEHDGPYPPPGYEDFVAGVDHLVMGRGTYEKVLTFGEWPYGSLSVVVLSTTLALDGDARITVARSVDEVLGLLERTGARGVYVDGGEVVRSFLRRDLVDELVVTRAPVLLEEGIPLFGSLTGDVRLTHRGTSTIGSGMTTSRYTVRRREGEAPRRVAGET